MNPSDAPIMILTLTSDTYSQGQLYDFASTQLAQKIAQTEGVGDVTVGRQLAACGAGGAESFRAV